MGKILIVGAGINGITAGIALKRRGHDVAIVDPGPVPHPLAASTDISKAVRSVYGADEDYTALAERSIPLWRRWNEEFGLTLYHETGMMFLRREAMKPGDFEFESVKVSERRGRRLHRLNQSTLRERFPAWSGELYRDGIFETEAGYVESGLVVATLATRAKQMGIEIR